MLANWLIPRLLVPGTDEPLTVPHTTFRAQAERGNVASIYSRGTSVEGRFREALTWPPSDFADALEEIALGTERPLLLDREELGRGPALPRIDRTAGRRGGTGHRRDIARGREAAPRRAPARARRDGGRAARTRHARRARDLRGDGLPPAPARGPHPDPRLLAGVGPRRLGSMLSTESIDDR
jgi:hypothetical protein